MDNKECIVKDCTNKYNGSFVGDIYYPCFEMITTGIIGRSHNFIAKLKREKQEMFYNRELSVVFMSDSMYHLVGPIQESELHKINLKGFDNYQDAVDELLKWNYTKFKQEK